MNLRIVKLDISGVELQLTRIADTLEGLLKSTDSPAWDTPATDENTGVFYEDEVTEILREQFAKRGKEYRKR